MSVRVHVGDHFHGLDENAIKPRSSPKVAKTSAICCGVPRADFKNTSVGSRDSSNPVIRYRGLADSYNRHEHNCVIIDGIDKIADSQIGNGAISRGCCNGCVR